MPNHPIHPSDGLADTDNPLLQGGQCAHIVIACDIFARINLFGQARCGDIRRRDIGFGGLNALFFIAIEAFINLIIGGALLHRFGAAVVGQVKGDAHAKRF